MVMGDTALTPFDMGTFGSQTTPRMWPQIRKAAAAAREMLLDLAAQEVERGSCDARRDRRMAASLPARTRAGFGELTKGEKLTRTHSDQRAPLTPATDVEDRRGHRCRRSNGREIVTGAHKYTYDIKRPGMLHGKVLYPPSFGATLTSLDSAAAEAMPGVKVVREGDFVGVAAPDAETAEQGAGRAQGGVEASRRPRPTAAASSSISSRRAQTAPRPART